MSFHTVLAKDTFVVYEYVIQTTNQIASMYINIAHFVHSQLCGNFYGVTLNQQNSLAELP